MSTRTVLFAAICFCCRFSPALAVIIDDFKVGPAVVEFAGSPPAASHVQTGLDPAHVIRGTRNILIGPSGSAGQRAEVDTAIPEFRFTTQAGLGYFQLIYGSQAPLNLNLIASGDRAFQLDYVQPITWLRVTSSAGIIPVTQTVSLSDASISTLSDGTKRARFSFKTFDEINLTHVSKIELQTVRSSSPIILKSFSTVVPEPASSIVFAIAGVMLHRRRLATAHHLLYAPHRRLECGDESRGLVCFRHFSTSIRLAAHWPWRGGLSHRPSWLH